MSRAEASSFAPAAQDPLVGAVLNERYKIFGPIGEGGMGIVYEAQHVVIEKRVALKVLRNDYSQRPEVVHRFRQEAKSASRIGHDHIVDISDFGETPSGQSYFVMEFLEGEDLATVLGKLGVVAPDRAIRIILQCCEALEAAHNKGIVHRDMKPENVFLISKGDEPDFVKIVDFGIAKMSDVETEGAPGRKLTKTGMIFGTPEYMSPEQAAGKTSLDHRVDVYALGVILYEMLSGRVPFVGDTFMGILTQHLFEEIPPISSLNPALAVSEELEAVVYKALHKEPDERYQSAAELADAIRAAAAGGVSVSLGSVSPLTPSGRPRRDAYQSEVPTVPPPAPSGGSSLRWIAVALIATVLGVAGLAVVQFGGSEPVAAGTGEVLDPDPDETGSDMNPPQEPPVDAGDSNSASAGENGAQSPVVPTEIPQRPVVTLTTDPAGATVTQEGIGVVCEATPCEVAVDSGSTVVLRARKGRLQGILRLEELRENQDAEIPLARRGGRPPRQGSTARTPMGGRMNGLKTPDWTSVN